MDDQAKYEALTSEFETVTASLCRPKQEGVVAYVHVFKDKGGLVRLDVATEAEDDRLQLVLGARKLQERLADPQDPSLW